MSQDSNLLVNPIPLIFDDDGSQDGMTALAYMLANPKFDLQAITISNGIARTEVFDDNLKRMLGRLGDTDIPVGVGRSTPLEGNNEFPDFIRDGSDTFWSPFVNLPEEVPEIETKPAVDLIIETIKNSPEPVAILATGPLTNIAEALRQDPSIIDNISIVQIMGGAVYVPGNLPVLPEPPFSTNETAEFNIWVDPVAAQEVFEFGEKGLKIQLTPLDATNQVEFDRQDYQEWLETGTPESAIAAELLDFALTVIQSDLDPNPVWDLVAAVNLSEPDFSEEVPLHIDVDTESEPGENQGQTKAVPGLNPNVLVSLDPNFDNIKFDAGEVFSYVELPVVNFSVDRTTIVEGGEAQILTFNLSEPAPSGGLVVNIRVDDPDGDSGPGDTTFPPEFISNITDFGQVEEDGIITASLTIAEGSSEATFGVVAFEDDLVEVGETYSFTLLEDENYIVATGSTTITTTIEDSDFMKPTVSFNADRTVVSEGGEAQLITFNLSEPAPEGGLAIKLRIDDPDGEPGDTENALELFSNVTDSNNRIEDGIFVANITIAEGATSATIGIKALTDNKVEGDETYSLTLLENENYIVDSASTTITTTIEDSDFMKPTVSITPETISSTEGNTFAWKFTLDKPVPEGGLTLSLPVTQNNDPAPGDVNYFVEGSTGITDFNFLIEDDVSLGFNLTLAPGVTEAILVSEAVADGIAESDEIFTTVLADGENYTANPDSNQVTTIISDEIIVSFTPEQVSVEEGNTFTWNFSLNKPAPAGGLTLNLPVTQNNDPAPGDVEYNVEGSTNISDFDFLVEGGVSLGFNLTIAEGETVAKLVSKAIADDIAEIDEIFTTVLADGENYRANPLNSEVVTTIVDSSTIPELTTLLNTSGGDIGSIDTEEGIFTPVFTDGSAWGDIALSPVNGLLFADTTTDAVSLGETNPDKLFSINPTTGKETFIGDLGVTNLFGLEFASDGVLYGTSEAGGFYSVNTETGAANLIATIPNFNAAGDLTFNEDSQEFLATSTSPDNSTLFAITTNGAARVVGDIGFTDVLGVKFDNGELFGYTRNGQQLEINPDTAQGTLIQDVAGLTGQVFGATAPIDLDFDNVSLVNTSGGDIGVIDTASGAFTPLFTDGSAWGDIALSPVNGLLFADTTTDAVSLGETNPDKLFSINPTTGEETFIGDLGVTNLFGLEFGTDGVLYGTSEAGGFYSVNTETGAANLIANIPDFNAAGDLTFNPNSREFLATSTSPDNTTLFAIATNGASRIVGDIGFTDVLGVQFDDGKLFGYTRNGQQLEINPNTAQGTLIQDVAGLTGQVFGATSLTQLVNAGDDTSVDLPNLSLNAEPTNVNEGEQLKFNFELSEAAPSGGLTVNLDLVEDTDPLPGDITYFVEGSENITDFELLVNDDTGLIDGATVTIAEGATSATLLNDIIADNNTEGPESVKFGLASGDYSIDSEDNAAGFTIVDTSTAKPTLAISAEPTNVNEGEQLKFNFELSEAAPTGGLTVNLDLVEDTDPLPGDITYFVDGSENITDFELLVNDDTGLIDGATVTIAEGATSATLLNDIIADNNTEGPESVKFGLTNGNYSIDSEDNAAGFTIVDTSTAKPTLAISAEPTNVNEGEQLKFNFELSEAAPTGGLTVNLDLVEDTDPLPGDINYFVDGSENITDFELLVNDDTGLIDGATVTIAEGATSATLLNDIIADNNTEGSESVKFGLTNGNYSIDSEDNAASFTIIDTSTDLPTLSLNAEPTNVNEGEQLKFNFELTEAAPSGGLTVNLDLVEDTDPLPGDINYFVDGSENITDFELLVNDDTGLIDGATVTIAEGATSATLLNDIIADNNTEGPESVKFGLTNGNYSIDSEDNAAGFTIVDTSTAKPTLAISAEPTNVNEGEQLKFNFELSEAAPSGGLTVNLDLVEDTDPLPGDINYFVDGSENITDFELLVNDDTGLIDGATVKIAEGATSATLLNDIIADNNTEGPESVKFGLADGNYSIDSEDNAAGFTIVDTSVANEISGTTGDDNLYGTNDAEIISGGRGDDNISGNGGGDTLIGGRGDDDIYGSFEADEISGGRGDDFIFGNGGNDLIDSGLGFDSVFLGAEESTVVLDKGEGFDTIFNFQLGATKFEVSSLDNLDFADSDSGAEIFLEGDKLAVVAGQSANTFSSNQDMIFAV